MGGGGGGGGVGRRRARPGAREHGGAVPGWIYRPGPGAGDVSASENAAERFFLAVHPPVNRV